MRDKSEGRSSIGKDCLELRIGELEEDIVSGSIRGIVLVVDGVYVLEQIHGASGR